jgi:DNA segregation ATPase FtsK/SpoIIIE, S-DNA-T family
VVPGEDPLTERAAPLPPAEPPDPASLPVARREDGPTYRLRLLGSHLLVVGATGSGKGSVLWSIVADLSPGVASGVVALWVLDPKGLMELAGGRRMFVRFLPRRFPDDDERAATSMRTPRSSRTPSA